MYLLLGLALAIGMGVDAKSAPVVPTTPITPTFREKFFTEVDKANNMYLKYYDTNCSASNYEQVDEDMRKEYVYLKSMSGAIRTEETDPMLQMREIETFLGFASILEDTVKSHRECEKNERN